MAGEWGGEWPAGRGRAGFIGTPLPSPPGAKSFCCFFFRKRSPYLPSLSARAMRGVLQGLLNRSRVDDAAGGGGLAGVGIDQVNVVAVVVWLAAHVVPADLQGGAGQLGAGRVWEVRAADGMRDWRRRRAPRNPRGRRYRRGFAALRGIGRRAPNRPARRRPAKGRAGRSR